MKLETNAKHLVITLHESSVQAVTIARVQENVPTVVHQDIVLTKPTRNANSETKNLKIVVKRPNANA